MFKFFFNLNDQSLLNFFVASILCVRDPQPEAFETLKGALERHRSQQSTTDQPTGGSSGARPTSAAPRVHYFGSKAADVAEPKHRSMPPIDTSHDYTTRQQQQHYQHIQHTPHSRYPESTPPSAGSENLSYEQSPNEELHPSDIPGQYIDPHERAGLPGHEDDDPDYFAEKRASHIVRAHTRGRTNRVGRAFSRIRDRSMDSTVSSEGPSRRNSHKGPPIKARDYADTERLDEIPREGTKPMPRPGGMLGLLLSLYNDEHLPSGFSTPASIRARSREREKSRQRPDRLPSTPGSPSSTPSPKASTSLLASGQQLVDDILGTNPTQKKSRNAGGVIGTLIASSGNLAGPAAPTSSQIQPNIKRPGFHLSRYVASFREPSCVPVSRKQIFLSAKFSPLLLNCI
jgi:hypothetical protein